MGVLKMTPQEFMRYTLNEYLDKCETHRQYQQNEEIRREGLLLWQAGAIAGLSWGKDFDPNAYFQQRQEAKKGNYRTDTDEELINLAIEKGLTPPETW